VYRLYTASEFPDVEVQKLFELMWSVAECQKSCYDCSSTWPGKSHYSTPYCRFF